MTDARIPERYLNDRRILKLTDTERSSYFMAGVWSVSNRTDGKFDDGDLDLIPTFSKSAIKSLIGSGLWARSADGYVDTEFMRVNTSRDDLEVLDNIRRADREKKARLAAHKKGNHDLCYPGVCEFLPGDIPGESSRGAHRRGEDRTGKDNTGVSFDENPPSGGFAEEVTNVSFSQQSGEVFDWDTAPIPGGDWGSADAPGNVIGGVR